MPFPLNQGGQSTEDNKACHPEQRHAFLSPTVKSPVNRKPKKHSRGLEL
jgi:hypothetical protein